MLPIADFTRDNLVSVQTACYFSYFVSLLSSHVDEANAHERHRLSHASGTANNTKNAVKPVGHRKNPCHRHHHYIFNLSANQVLYIGRRQQHTIALKRLYLTAKKDTLLPSNLSTLKWLSFRLQ